MLVDLEGWIVLGRRDVLRSEDLLCLIDEEAWDTLFHDDESVAGFSERGTPGTFTLWP